MAHNSLFATVSLIATLALVGAANGDLKPAESGRALANAHCARCHAIGKSGNSPFAPAPTFLDIANRWPPGVLGEAFAEGIVVGHPDMPEFVFEPDDIGDLIAYLETLRAR